MESLQSLVSQLLSVQDSGLALCQAPGETIEFKGKKFVSDDTKGFVRFSLAHSFPVVTAYGQCLSPNVLAKSYNSLEFQNFNLEHKLKVYDPEKQANDRILGTILAVDFPQSPSGGFKVQSDRAKAPGIEGVAVFTKLAQGMDTMIGKHKTGRKKMAVSFECQFPYQDSGFLVALNGKPPQNETPQDFVDAGYEYVPWNKAPDLLLATFSVKKKKIVGKYKGRDTYLMMGGLDAPVHFAGVGLVEFGAEREAQVISMAASISEEEKVLLPLFSLANLIQ